MTERTYIPLTEVQQRTSLPPRTLARRLADGTVPLYIDGRDRRRRLVAVEDLPALTKPRPVERRGEGVRPPAA